jgi:hypothetical protein
MQRNLSIVPSPPTEAFFNSDPEAAEIRRLTLVGICTTMAILHNDNSPATSAELRGSVGALRQWDITEGMHAQRPTNSHEVRAHRSRIMSSPRLVAEYVAGTFLTYLQQTGSLTGPSQAILNRHNALDIDAGITEAVATLWQNVPAMQGYTLRVRLLNGFIDMLDHDGSRVHDDALGMGQAYQKPAWG